MAFIGETLEHKLETYFLIPYALKKSMKLRTFRQTCKSDTFGGFVCHLSMKRNIFIWCYLYFYTNTLQHELKMFFLKDKAEKTLITIPKFQFSLLLGLI